MRHVKIATPAESTGRVEPLELGIESSPYIAIIGGSGLYDPGIFKEVIEAQLHTPYGNPSDNVIIGRLGNEWVVFLARHGKGHRYPPHKIPYKANIWALRTLGVKVILSVSAVGSLREDYEPGDFVVPDQFVDMTKNRDYSFFNGPCSCHLQVGNEPFTEELRKIVIEESRKLNKTHDRGCYICIEGPRFSTIAESRIWREVFKCDIVGMTLIPELTLARELGMCYVMSAVITDYDILVPHKPVTAEEVVKRFSEKIEIVKKVMINVIPRVPRNIHEKCEKILETACI